MGGWGDNQTLWGKDARLGQARTSSGPPRLNRDTLQQQAITAGVSLHRLFQVLMMPLRKPRNRLSRPKKQIDQVR